MKYLAVVLLLAACSPQEPAKVLHTAVQVAPPPPPPPPPPPFDEYPAANSPATYTVREVTTQSGRKCVVVSQGDFRGGVGVTCDWLSK